MVTTYECSLKYTEHKLDRIRSRLEELPLGDAVVLVCGSYARREASDQSDIDYVMVSDGTDADPALNESVFFRNRRHCPQPTIEGRCLWCTGQSERNSCQHRRR